MLERGLHWLLVRGLCQVPERGLQGLQQLLGLDSYQLLERGLCQVPERGLCRLQQRLGLPEAQLAPLGSAHMSSGSSRQQAILC